MIRTKLSIERIRRGCGIEGYRIFSTTLSGQEIARTLYIG
jgi:hypothetical protein